MALVRRAPERVAGAVPDVDERPSAHRRPSTPAWAAQRDGAGRRRIGPRPAGGAAARCSRRPARRWTSASWPWPTRWGSGAGRPAPAAGDPGRRAARAGARSGVPTLVVAGGARPASAPSRTAHRDRRGDPGRRAARARRARPPGPAGRPGGGGGAARPRSASGTPSARTARVPALARASAASRDERRHHHLRDVVDHQVRAVRERGVGGLGRRRRDRRGPNRRRAGSARTCARSSATVGSSGVRAAPRSAVPTSQPSTPSTATISPGARDRARRLQHDQHERGGVGGRAVLLGGAGAEPARPRVGGEAAIAARWVAHRPDQRLGRRGRLDVRGDDPVRALVERPLREVVLALADPDEDGHAVRVGERDVLPQRHDVGGAVLAVDQQEVEAGHAPASRRPPRRASAPVRR